MPLSVVFPGRAVARVHQDAGSAYTNMMNDLGSIESQACVQGFGSACTGWF